MLNYTKSSLSLFLILYTVLYYSKWTGELSRGPSSIIFFFYKYFFKALLVFFFKSWKFYGTWFYSAMPRIGLRRVVSFLGPKRLDSFYPVMMDSFLQTETYTHLIVRRKVIRTDPPMSACRTKIIIASKSSVGVKNFLIRTNDKLKMAVN